MASVFPLNQNNVLSYQTNPNKVQSTVDIDIIAGHSYNIDGIEVLTSTALGSGVTSSKLTKVGILNNLQVNGNLNIADHVFFNEATEKLGIGTDAPNAALSVVENSIELVLGSLSKGTGHVGTYTTNDLSIVTDNVERIKISRTGKIVIGHPVAQNADVEIQGRLFVRQLVVDQSDNNNSPLEFKAANGSSNYGKGILFTSAQTAAKQFVLSANPDSFYSSEHINLDNTKSYLIAGLPVLSMDRLGSSVTQSNLTRLGQLSELEVQGSSSFAKTVSIEKNLITINDGSVISTNQLSIGNNTQNINIDINAVNFGSKDTPTTKLIINGKLAIGVQNVSADVNFETSGNIRFADRLFAVDSAPPNVGSYNKGDIIWNSNPVETGNVGWVCVTTGTPGVWRGFGQIGIA
jgi:uncharacterized protein YdeI (BOF family)